MNVKFKIWIEQDGGVAFAEGRRLLLEEIERLGSINAAAKELGMSYRAAWGKIKATEKVLGIRLLEVAKGGKGGGGAVLTQDARHLIDRYNEYKDRMNVLAQKEFWRIFDVTP